MSGRLDTLPKFFRSEQTPVKLDLAFPPFKLEHRYRGVYERAGFDVNVGNNDNGSMKSPKLDVYSIQRINNSNNNVNNNKQNIYNQSYDNNGNNNGITRPNSPHIGTTPMTANSNSFAPTPHHLLMLLMLQLSSSPGTSRMNSKTAKNGNSNNVNTRGFYTSSSSDTRVDERGQISPTLNGSFSKTQKDVEQLDRNGSHTSSSTKASGQSDRLFSGKSENNIYSDISGLSSASSGFAPKSKGYFKNGDEDLNDYPTRNPSRPTIDIASSFVSSGGVNKDYPTRIDSQRTQDRNIQSDNMLTASLHFPDHPQSAKNFKNLSIKTNSNNNSNDNDTITDITRKVAPSAGAYKPASKYKKSGSGDFDQNSNFNQRSISSIETHEVTNDQHHALNDTFTRKKRLSLAMDDFKRDIEDLKKFTPKSTPVQQQPPKFVVDNYDTPTSNYSGDEQQYLNHNQYYQQQQQQQPQSDYQQFLQLDSNAANNLRHSQILMVSLILLKGSVNDNDLEIDRELERQLQSLKTGANHETDRANEEGIDHSNVSFEPSRLNGFNEFDATTNDTTFELVQLKFDDMQPQESVLQDLPTFNIQEEGEFEMAKAPLISNASSVKFVDQQFDSMADSETNGNQVVNNFEDIEDPRETISINSHRMQDQRGNTPEFEESPVRPLVVRRELKDNIGAEDLQPIPMAKLQEPVSKERQNSRPQIHLPGEGPCRACGQEVHTMAKGSQKAIFSKSGDLSGQWHRACFQCSNQCGTQFKKGIQVYELNDNPYCHNCYHALNNTLCQECGNGIEGECIENELEQKWHLACLACNECQCQILSDYYLVNGKVFCEEDAIRRQKKSNTADRIEKRRTRLLFID